MAGGVEKGGNCADCEEREGKEVGDYRGMTAMSALYKKNI